MTSFNQKKWKVSLPVFPPTDVMDASVRSEYGRCPRRAFYRYGLRRGFDGKSWTIQFGLAVHKYEEVAERMMRELSMEMNSEIHDAAQKAAFEGWENPPIEHRHSFLDMARLAQTLQALKRDIIQEKKIGDIIVTREEDSFDLELPFALCSNCHYSIFTNIRIDEVCPRCGRRDVIYPRHGGRVDQHAVYTPIGRKRIVRDFKTTSRMGAGYEKKFDPSTQLQGYKWSGEGLSGEPYDGVLVKTIYNTKTQGPSIFQHYIQYSKGQQEAWLASTMIETQIIHELWDRVEELGYLAFPQRTTACGDYGGCGFRAACQLGSAFEIEAWLEERTIYSHWDFTNPEEEEGT